MEWKRDNFTISDDASRLDLDAIADFLSRAYWAETRPRDVIERSVQHSLNIGVYDGKRQIGFARVVTDRAVFAYLCDVFIHEGYRGQALGKWMMECIVNHPELQGLRRWCLVTRDAHGLYNQFGFAELNNPERWMEKFDSGR
ncbi:MAG: N-acetyltransferase [Anaerolineaceae bacterium]|jgi:N-acetylglutamate synthase-like GNAT family acetyltransferase|nr:MAG: N-acetyltransferase [Anaerolineaceae bacterium]